MSKVAKSDSNVSLLLFGMLILITGVAVSSVFSENFAFAQTDEAKEEAKKALEKAKNAIDGTDDSEDIGDGDISEEEKEAREAEAQELEEQQQEQEEAEAAQEESEETIEAAEDALEQAQSELGIGEEESEEAETEEAETEEAETEEAETEETTDDSTTRTRSSSSGGGGAIPVPVTEEAEDDSDLEKAETEESTEEATEETTEESSEDATEETEESTEEASVNQLEATETETEEVDQPITITVNGVEDSTAGTMVSFSGDGADEGKRLQVKIFSATDDEKIVKLKIKANRDGEYSTVWIKGSDINYDSFTIQVEDRTGDKAETTFTITDDGFIDGLPEEETEDPVDEPTDEDEIEKPEVDPNLDLEGRVTVLEGIVNVMQGIIDALTTSIDGFQTQIDDEAAAREASDIALQNQINALDMPQLVAYQRSIMITVPAGEQSSHTITCPDGNVAQSGGIEILSAQMTQFKTYSNHMDGIDGWIVEAANTHESDSVDMTLYVNCLKVEAASEDTPEIAPVVSVEPVVLEE